MSRFRSAAVTAAFLVGLITLWIPSVGAMRAERPGLALPAFAAQSQASPTPVAAQAAQFQVRSFAGLVDVAFANFNVLSQAVTNEQFMNQLLRSGAPGQQLRVAYVGNPAGLTQFLNDSITLGRYVVLSRTVASNSQAIQAVLQQNNLARDRVVGLDLVSGQPTIYVLGARASSAPTAGATPQPSPSPLAIPASLPNPSPSPRIRG